MSPYAAVINVPVPHGVFGHENLYLDEDVRHMAVTVYGEARGEPLEGQVAVAYVIRNRAATRKQTISEVVHAPFQFSCWNPYDPNRQLIERILRDWDNSFARLRILRQCWWITIGVLCGFLRDYSSGATHYVTKRLFHSDMCPDWAQKLDIKACVGEHIFLA